jgi:histidinol-phosphate aminotransferase
VHFRQNILKMNPYHPPLSGRLSSGQLLLDFNERVTPVHEAVRQAMTDWVNSGASWCYPEYDGLEKALSQYALVEPQHIFFGNGSDQLLDCIFRAVVDPGDLVLLPSPSFAMYAQCADLVEAKTATFSYLAEDPLAELKKALSQQTPRMVVICQPNNPTGTFLDVPALRQLFDQYPNVWFLVDEAYYEFSSESVLENHQTPRPNVVVTRTFSKAFGLAALRFGYMVASEDLNEQCGKIRGPYDINRLVAIAAEVALNHLDEVKCYAREVMEEAKPLLEGALKNLGCDFMASRSNFLLVKNPPLGLVEHLDNSGIRVRAMRQKELTGACRISIGNVAATQKVLAALRNFKQT